MIARIVSVALLCLGLFCLAQAQVPMTGAGKGAPGGGGGSSYVGPGDLVPGAVAWSGLRAYSAATAGGKVANICNPTDATGADCADWSSDATTGDLVATTINGADCTMVTCSVKFLYDQTGNTNCSTGISVPCDFAPAGAGAADRPSLAFGSTNCTGTTSKWCMTYDGMTQRLVSSTILGVTTTITISQPLTQSFIFYHTNAGRQDISPNFGVNFGGAANEAYGFFGNFTPITVGAGFDGAWHAAHIVANGASGDIHIDSTANTNDLGASGISGNLFCGRNSNFFAGKMVECGSWGSAVSSGDMDAMAANAKTYWGWP